MFIIFNYGNQEEGKTNRKLMMNICIGHRSTTHREFPRYLCQDFYFAYHSLQGCFASLAPGISFRSQEFHELTYLTRSEFKISPFET
jgi:hypothetical protein